jgi:hypothetical protein
VGEPVSNCKVFRPNIPQWDHYFQRADLEALVENPTHEQLAILKSEIEERKGRSFGLNLFVLVFGTFIDEVSKRPPITPVQRSFAFVELLKVALSLTEKWLRDIPESIEVYVD